MQADLKLTSSDYSLILSIFFIVSLITELPAVLTVSKGYLLNEVPCNMILARSRPSRFLPAIMFVWVSRPGLHRSTCNAESKQGCMSIAVKGVNSFGGMVGWRFCLGLVEAGFFPGVMLLLSCWYKVSPCRVTLDDVRSRFQIACGTVQTSSDVLHSLPRLRCVRRTPGRRNHHRPGRGRRYARLEVAFHHRGSYHRRTCCHRLLCLARYVLTQRGRAPVVNGVFRRLSQHNQVAHGEGEKTSPHPHSGRQH
jgi:hypothetical protein